MAGRIRGGREALAGLAGAIGSVPDGMAMAVLAGANPMSGLYASIAGPVAGGLVQSNAVMVVTTTSAAAVTAQQTAGTAGDDPARALATLTVLTGVAILVATWLGAPRLLRFVSASVMSGFILGVGITLVLGQLGDAAGVSAEGATVIARAWDTVTQVGAFQAASVATAAGAIAIGVLVGRTRLAALSPLAAIVGPTAAVALTQADVATVAEESGQIANGLPPLALPDLALLSPTVASTALALMVVVLVQSAGVTSSHPAPGGAPSDHRRDFLAQGAGNVASAVVGGIPVGASVGQTALNVLAGGRTRWAVVTSGLWMLLFVVALGPLLSEVPLPALAGLLILAGWRALRPGELLRSWRTGAASGIAASLTLLATLVLPVHLAVLCGVALSLLLVGIGGASEVRVVALGPGGPGRWRRGERPTTVPAGAIVVLDLEGPAAFTSVSGLVDRLPAPPDAGSDPGRRAVVLRLPGYVRTNLTMVTALERYDERLAAAHGRLVLCGLAPGAVAQLRRIGLPERIEVVPEGEELGASLDEAYVRARGWVDQGA